jgi:hypothetical protein
MKTTLISLLFVLTAFVSFGQWTYTNLSEPKAYMGATVLGSKAYFAGGYNNSNLLSTVEIYDNLTGEWDTTNDLSVARQLPFAGTCGSKIFFAGGANFSTGAVYGTVDIFDTVTQQWTVEQLSVPRLQVAVVSHGNKVLFAGGANLQQGVVYDIVDIYNIETGEWLPPAALSEPRVVWWATVGNLAIFAGGYNLQTSSKRVDIYNFTTNTWSIDSLSVPRAFIGITTLGNKVFFAGGMINGNTASNVVDIYDAESGTWDTANLSLARAFSDNQNVVTSCGKAYFVGGGKINLNGAYWTAAYNVIDIYDEATNTWTVDQLSQSFVHRAVLSFGDKYLVAGGIGMNNGYQSEVQIYSCPSSSCLPEGITFTTQEQIDNFQTNYPGCNEIEGNVTINGIDISNLNGLNVVTSIGGSLLIFGNDILINLSGLNSLNIIGGGLRIHGNAALSGLTGMSNLNSIGGDLEIGFDNAGWWVGNPVLNNLSGLEGLVSIGENLWIGANGALTSLTGLNALTMIGGSLTIALNGLSSLAGLNSLTSINGSLIINNNDYLTSLTGLDNIDGGTIQELNINGNLVLSDCDVQSICDYLASPNGIFITDNAPGCNSPEEVEEHCFTEVKDVESENGITIIPNPAKDRITVSVANRETIDEIVIYNQTGQKVLQRKPINNTLDISKLHQGLYIIELETEKGKIREKLIVQ